MKHFLLLAGLAGSLASARAQAPAPEQSTRGPVLSVGIYGPSANVGVQVEQPLGRHFSLGAFGSRQFSSDFRGYQGALAGRYYFRPTAPTGLYLQATVGIYNTHALVQTFYPGATNRSELHVQGSGGGLGLGYQWRFAQHLTATIGLGVKAYPTNLGTCDCGYTKDWYATGQPGSVLDGQLSIGYAL